MILYIITREENNRTSIWAPLSSYAMASDVIDTHVSWRTTGGDTIHRETRFVPDNIKVKTEKNIDTLLPSCVVREVELVKRDGGRTIYRITQHPLIEEQEQPFLLTNKKNRLLRLEDIDSGWGT